MCELEKNIEIRYTKKQRLIAALICAACIFVPFLSSFYIVREADHDCTGAGCPICACIQQCEHHLKQIATGKVGEMTTVTPALFLTVIVSLIFCLVCCTTLVSQKVRLNN